MEKPTCYVRFDEQGQTIVWMRCPACGAEIVIHPQAHMPPRPWFELRCGECGRTPGERVHEQAK
ncbi:MAG: hypothetical protein ACRD2J_06910 [Thermoanaerobaculia bacterium]